MSETTNDMNSWRPDPPDDDPDPLGIIGKTISGKYLIDAFITEGGFGKVYSGTNINLEQQKVVIKFFTEAKLQNRFDKEAQILCMLDHPGICSLIDYLPRERALVIPYIDGIDLHKQLKEQGPLSADQFMLVASSVLDAMEFAHSKSIAHRDIKPSNIMIDKNNNVSLIDFGIAKEIKDSDTKTTFFLGTPDFAAPERRRNNDGYNPFLSDIYELGITLFYLTTRRHLYRDRDHPDPADWNLPGTSTLSPRLKRILRKATDPDPTRRYQSVAAMAADFLKVKHPYRKASPLRRTAIIAASIAIVLLGADAVNQRYKLADVPVLIHWFAEEADPEIVMNIPLPSITDPLMEEHEFDSTRETVADTSPPVVADESIEATPVPPQMKIEVFPPGLMQMKVDGQGRRVNEYFETTSGQHEIVIEHADFPIYRTYASVSADTARLEFDLRDRFTGLDSTNVILITLPRDDRYGFDLMCNGRRSRFNKTRNFAFYLRNGLWHISADMKPLDTDAGSKPKVDSIVVGVVGKAVTSVIMGNDGYLNVNSGPAGDQKMRLLIYWSETSQNAGR